MCLVHELPEPSWVHRSWPSTWIMPTAQKVGPRRRSSRAGARSTGSDSGSGSSRTGPNCATATLDCYCNCAIVNYYPRVDRLVPGPGGEARRHTAGGLRAGGARHPLRVLQRRHPKPRPEGDHVRAPPERHPGACRQCTPWFFVLFFLVEVVAFKMKWTQLDHCLFYLLPPSSVVFGVLSHHVQGNPFCRS